jgi:hopanoid biosynthesis associated RND transporter like protein HpnN
MTIERQPFFVDWIKRLVKACCAYPLLTLTLALILTIAAGFYAAQNFGIQTDTSKLISPDLPWRQRELQLDAAFPGQADTFLIVIDGQTPELAASAAKSLAAALAKMPKQIKAVYDPEGGAFFESNGLLYLKTDEVKSTTEELIRAQAFLGTLSADPTLRGLAQALAFVPKGVEEGAIQFKDFATPLSLLGTTIDELVAGIRASFSWNALMTGEAPTRNELRRFIRVKPVLDFEALQPGKDAANAIREEAKGLGLLPEKGVTLRLTGPVAMADDEFATVADGALLNVLLTSLAVLIILWFALRSTRVIFAVMASLFVGLVITAALGLAMVGELNLISVAFAVLFVGIGVDFGIQFAVRYRAERHRHMGLNAGLTSTSEKIAKPLALAGRRRLPGFMLSSPLPISASRSLGSSPGRA